MRLLHYGGLTPPVFGIVSVTVPVAVSVVVSVAVSVAVSFAVCVSPRLRRSSQDQAPAVRNLIAHTYQFLGTAIYDCQETVDALLYGS